MSKKIAIFTASDISKTQGSTEVHYLTKYLSEDYNVHVYSCYNPDLDDITYHQILSFSRIPALLYNIVFMPYFLTHMWKHDFDLLYSYKDFNLLPYLLSRFTGTRWVIDLRTKPIQQKEEWDEISGVWFYLRQLYYSLYKQIYIFTLPRAEAVITLSHPLKEYLIREYSVESSNIHLVPLGVDVELFQFNENNSEISDSIDLVYLGSITKHRGLDLFINLLAQDKIRNSFHLHLIGDGPQTYIQKLKQKIRDNGLENSVTWYGYVDHDNIPDVLSRMDVAVSPLPEHDSYEVSSPAKIYEYLAVGLPVICTDITPHRNLLKEGETGFFFDYESPETLPSILNKIYKMESTDWQSRRKQARRKALDNSWSSRLKTVTKIIDESGEY